MEFFLNYGYQILSIIYVAPGWQSSAEVSLDYRKSPTYLLEGPSSGLIHGWDADIYDGIGPELGDQVENG
jgi:hypothetical protein